MNEAKTKPQNCFSKWCCGERISLQRNLAVIITMLSHPPYKSPFSVARERFSETMLMSIVSGKQRRQASYFVLRLFSLTWATAFFWLLNDRERRYWIIYYYLLHTVIYWLVLVTLESTEECRVLWVPAAPPPRTISPTLDHLHLIWVLNPPPLKQRQLERVILNAERFFRK